MRGLLKMTIGLAVLAGLLVGADRVAVGVVQDEAAGQLVSSGRLSSKPTVSIDGFPFLTQALAGTFDSVRLSGDGVTVSDGRQQAALRSFTARLSGVEVGSDYRSATVRSGTGSGLISYPDVAKLIQGAERVDLSYGGPGKVRASVAGVEVGQGNVHSSGNTITADGFQLAGMGSLLSGQANAALGPRSFTLTDLPAGLSLAAATPQQDGLLLAFQGTNLKLIG
ncbi:DUF2993 domain-containing protein [Kitasatospora sp. MAP5-34]|uniref:LmeA family phospholipid-binding protein n=1 Tax=Kitasatospora sp. MAP5-34 TaxID=3035102 RepID=UPI0024730A4C|nr:DUF2993 domain-containing protein [Kitasatospora sp. MAP5-34]MDH6579590.1 hypothetical protein [Kitasatospora sp. MAP5-34]